MRKLGVVVAALCIALAGSAQAETGVTDTEVTIGALGVLTGPLYNYGKTVYDGVETVFDEVNAAGGINGRKIRYVREDDQCKPDVGVPAVRKLIFEDNVFMIHGASCSNAALAELPEIVRAKIPWVITASTAPELTDPINPMIFTTTVAGWMETVGQLQRVIDLGGKKVAIVRQHDAWAQSRYQPLLDAMKQHGMKPVADEEIAPNPTDATAAALKVQLSGADSVILLLFPQSATIFMRDMYKIGYKPIVIGGSPLGDVAAMAQAIGIPGAAAKFQALRPSKAPDDASVDKWRPLVKKYFPNEEFTTWHMLGIASAQFVVEALRKAGPDLTRAHLAEAMSTLSMTPDVYAGPIACTPTNHQCYASFAWFSAVNNKMVQVGETTIPEAGPK